MYCMRMLLNPIYRGDPEPKRMFRLLWRFQITGNLPGNRPPFLLFDLEDELVHANIVMADKDIIGIDNDRARNIMDYAVFDPNSMNNDIIRPEIIVAQFEFKPMLFQLLQAIGQYSGVVDDDPHFHLRQFLEVAINFKIPSITDDTFQLRLFTYSLRCRAKSWLNSLEPNFIVTWNALDDIFFG